LLLSKKRVLKRNACLTPIAFPVPLSPDCTVQLTVQTGRTLISSCGTKKYCISQNWPILSSLYSHLPLRVQF